MARAVEDMTGRKFGRLTVLQRVLDPRRGAYWSCACDCGGTTVAPSNQLRSGNRVSCGCQMADTKRRHGYSGKPEYKAWENARSRCRNPKNRKYPLYGGRGIVFCDRWMSSFENFLADLGPRPSPFHSLERNDSDGNYDPGNCRWATAEEQNNNRSINRHLIVDGVRMTVAQAARQTGICHATILGRLDAGKSDLEATSNG